MSKKLKGKTNVLARPATEAEWRQWADRVVDTVNERVSRVSLEFNAVADYLFREVFENDVDLALSKRRRRHEAYRLIRARAGKSLRLSKTALSRLVRIGALNQIRRDDAWHGLEWTKKAELLSLLRLDDARKTFNEGVLVAIGPNMGQKALRAWVQARLPEGAAKAGRPRGFTLAAGNKLAEAGVKLGDDAARAKFVQVLDKADPAERKAFLRDLKDAHANIGRLLAELGAKNTR
jgi:hypothetical protein